MLQYRIITIAILLPIFLVLLFYLSPLGFLCMTSGVMIWATWEWTYLLDLKRFYTRFLYLIVVIIVSIFLLYMQVYLLLKVSFIWWCLAAILVGIYPRGSWFWAKGIVWRSLMGCFVLIPCWISFLIIRNMPGGVYNLLFLFILIWSADTGAYCIGKLWGNTKLAPHVSPGKTWEGTVGGIVISMLVALFIFWYTSINLKVLPYAFFLSLITVLFSIVGDLFESMLKREVNLKDSGRLLPGHGGLLDRIDSLTAAAPVFLFLSLYITKHMMMG